MKNREIKFRIWSHDLKMFVTHENCLELLPNEIEYHDDYASDFGHFFASLSSIIDSCCAVQQFIGFFDSEKKEIYEGDILKHDIGLGPIYYEVIWDSENGRWAITKDNGGNIGPWFNYYTIAGNISENPELLQ